MYLLIHYVSRKPTKVWVYQQLQNRMYYLTSPSKVSHADETATVLGIALLPA